MGVACGAPSGYFVVIFFSLLIFKSSTFPGPMVKETKDLKNKTRGRPSSLRAVGGTNERTNASRFSVEERRRRRRRGVEGGRREGVGEVGGSSLSKLDMWRTRPLALTLQPSAPLLQTLPGPAGRHTCP